MRYLPLHKATDVRRRFFWVTVSLIVVIMAILPLFVPSYDLGLLILVLIFAIFAMSLDILVGYTGLPSLGHAAFFGAAGYTVALLNLRWPATNFGLELVAALGMALLLAAVFGVLALRAKEFHFLTLTFALAQLLWGIAFKWRSFTGGDDGLSGISRPDLDFLHWDMGNIINYYHFVLLCFIAAMLLMYWIVHSPFGHALKGINENETRMTALGYNIWLYKYIAFTLSGTFAGFAGILFTYYNGFIHPSYLGVLLSLKGYLMVVLGGAGTLIGPIAGAALLIFLENYISAFTERWALMLGIIFVLVMLFAPKGISGLVRRELER